MIFPQPCYTVLSFHFPQLFPAFNRFSFNPGAINLFPVEIHLDVSCSILFEINLVLSLGSISAQYPDPEHLMSICPIIHIMSSLSFVVFVIIIYVKMDRSQDAPSDVQKV